MGLDTHIRELDEKLHIVNTNRLAVIEGDIKKYETELEELRLSVQEHGDKTGRFLLGVLERRLETAKRDRDWCRARIARHHGFKVAPAAVQ